MFLCKWGVSKIVDPQNHRFQSKHDYHKFPNPWRKNAKSSIYCLAFSWIFYDINHPPDRKPRVTALTFVHNLFGTKCTKREVSAHFNFFWFFFVAIPWCSFFLSISCGGNEFFSVLQVQKEAATSACESVSHTCQSKLGQFSQATLAVQLLL